MSKSKSFVKYLKRISSSINNLLERNLNKLKFENLLNIARSNKIFLSFVAVSVLFLSYLSIPNLFKQPEISLELKKKIYEKFKIEFNFYFQYLRGKT